MRSLDETLSRWKKTQESTTTLEELRHAVRYNGSASPCSSGCRSLCWKTFLLSQASADLSWSQLLLKGRTLYSERREHLLKFIKHPEALAELTIDPLADDPNSPWNTVRQDEIIRVEILQDVQRLPDEASYHEESTQTMILDILFVYCKLNPNRGGYRQGMHELLAPIVYVMQQDAIDHESVPANLSLDETMLQVLDAKYIEHDAFVLFSRVMDSAQSFYEIRDPNPNPAGLPPSARFQEQSSAIVERSKFIHEVCLRKIDPDLATHLTSIEILPQIFLIRWVRLLFSREFPFEDFLALWDTIFAVDPTLELIDLICVAMLIRIRWDLLEADYSVCLQLLLKYPPPASSHGPQAFVDDALYLRNHLSTSGGASLIMKYTGRMPTVSSPPENSRSNTPNFRAFNSFKQRGFGTRSPLPSPSRFLQQQGGMEALFQGAAKGAKGVLERGEKLGINQAVRDAVGEIRRNLNEARYPVKSPREILSEEGPMKGLAALEKRNQQLAGMLEETVENLKSLSTSNLDDKAKSLELIEVAAAKIQFVMIYLEDSSMEVPILDSPPVEEESIEEPTPEKDIMENSKGKERQPDSTVSTPVEVNISSLKLDDKDSTLKKENTAPSPNPDAMDTSDDKPMEEQAKNNNTLQVRPSAPIPTRSSLAQSSFSWMLEPDESSSTHPPTAATRSPPSQHKKRASNNASRERNAFLFGEVQGAAGRDPLISDDIFGLQPMHKSKESES